MQVRWSSCNRRGSSSRLHAEAAAGEHLDGAGYAEADADMGHPVFSTGPPPLHCTAGAGSIGDHPAGRVESAGRGQDACARTGRRLCPFEGRAECDSSAQVIQTSTGLSLSDVGAIDRVGVGRHVVNTKGDEIAAAQLAVDGKIEQSQVACATLEMEFGADQPHAARPQRRLRAGELALVPRWSLLPVFDDDGLLSFMVSLPG